MPPAARTIDARLIVGRPDWVVNLTGAVGGIDLAGDVAYSDREAVMQQRETEIFAVSQVVNPSLTELYAGVIVDALRTHVGEDDPPTLCIIDDKADAFYAIEVLLGSRAYKGPTTDLIKDGIETPWAERGYAGIGTVAVTPFTFDSSAASVAIGAVPAAASIHLVVEAYTAAISSEQITAAGIDQTVEAAGVWKLTPPANAVSAAVVASGHSIAGAQEISGYVLVGEEMGVV